jgi:hypothetical protein
MQQLWKDVSGNNNVETEMQARMSVSKLFDSVGKSLMEANGGTTLWRTSVRGSLLGLAYNFVP